MNTLYLSADNRRELSQLLIKRTLSGYSCDDETLAKCLRISSSAFKARLKRLRLLHNCGSKSDLVIRLVTQIQAKEHRKLVARIEELEDEIETLRGFNRAK